MNQLVNMSVNNFVSLSSVKPIPFIGITNGSRFLSWKNGKTWSIIKNVHSKEPLRNPVNPNYNPSSNNNVMHANAMVVTGPTLEERSPISREENASGSAKEIGINKFMDGKSFLITGATGYLSKVLVEKMLRTSQNICKIYLLIRAVDKDDAMKRLRDEIIDLELFQNMKEIYGKSLEESFMSKIVPVVGNICESNLGINLETAYEIANEVDVIVNSAGITSFDERYDISLEVNTRGPSRLLDFAKKCKKLKVLLHFSTAFANKDKNGMIYEEPLYLDKRMLMEEDGQKSLSEMDIEAEFELALKSRESFQAQNVAPRLKELGLNRARFYGWPNTYSFTKAMGEMLMNDQRGDVPLVIIRPTIIESTYSEPFPGWIQGNRVLDPFIIHYGKGQLEGVFGDPDVHFNIVPADMVVNASLAAMAKHGIESKPGINVYHVVSSETNPILIRDFFNFSCKYFASHPFTDSQGKRVNLSDMKYFSEIDDLRTFLFSGVGEEMTKLKRKRKPLLHISEIYQPYFFFRGRLESLKMKKLMECMSEEEKEEFQFDFEGINWEHYMLKVHIPGVKKHVLKGRDIV